MNSPQVKAYLSRLNKHLSPLTANEKTEILQEIESRIHDEYALLTDNENQDSEVSNILVRMGAPERLAKQLRAEHLNGVLAHASLGEHYRAFWRGSLRPMLLGLMALALLFLLRNAVLIAQSPLPLSLAQQIQLFVGVLPEVFMLGLPIVLSLGCALYVHHTISTQSAGSLSARLKMWGIVLGLGLLTTLTSAIGYQTLVIPQQTQRQALIASKGDALSLAEREAAMPEQGFVKTFEHQQRWAIPSANLGFALWGGATGLIMASGLVGLSFSLIGVGVLVPGVIWWISSETLHMLSSFVVPAQGFPLFTQVVAYLPSFMLLTIAGSILLGHLLGSTLAHERER